METVKSSEPQSVWEMDASSAWSWIKTSIRNRWRKSLTALRSSSGVKLFGNLLDSYRTLTSAREHEELSKMEVYRPPGTEALNQYRKPSLMNQVKTQQSGYRETSGPVELVWSEPEKCFVPPRPGMRSGRLLRLPWE